MKRLLALALAVACQSAPSPRPTPCNGPEVLVVRNETGEPVDVYALRGLDPIVNVGTAGTGRTEFPLP